MRGNLPTHFFLFVIFFWGGEGYCLFVLVRRGTEKRAVVRSVETGRKRIKKDEVVRENTIKQNGRKSSLKYGKGVGPLVNSKHVRDIIKKIETVRTGKRCRLQEKSKENKTIRRHNRFGDTWVSNGSQTLWPHRTKQYLQHSRKK